MASLLLGQPAAAQTITITDQALTPRVLTYKVGQRVRLTVQNRGQRTHNLVFPDFSLVSQPISPGATTRLEFEANRPGRFAFYSDYPNPQGVPEPGLSGTLIIR